MKCPTCKKKRFTIYKRVKTNGNRVFTKIGLLCVSMQHFFKDDTMSEIIQTKPLNRTEVKKVRDLILAQTNLKWTGKNKFTIKDYTLAFPLIFQNLKVNLEELGYEIDPIIRNAFKKCFSVKFKKINTHENYYMDFKLIKTRLSEIFTLIDDNLQVKGYTGSNEWKRDLCLKHKVPMIDELAYLDPEEGYWFNNELSK